MHNYVWRIARRSLDIDAQSLCTRCLSTSPAALLDALQQRRARSVGSNSLEPSTATAPNTGCGTWRLRHYATDTAAETAADTKPSDTVAVKEDRARLAQERRRRAIPRVHRPPTLPQNVQAAATEAENASAGSATSGLRPAAGGVTDTRSTLEAKKQYRLEKAEKARQDAQRVAAEQAAASATLAAKQAAREESKRQAAEDREAPRKALLSTKALGEKLGQENYTKYIELRRDLLPEIFVSEPQPQFQRMLPKGSCPGLLEELEATKSDHVMFRYCMHKLLNIAKDGRRHVYLTGPASSGKSIALAFTVSQLRAEGWLVLYIPAALQLTHGGTFSRHADEGWDTPECAKLVLHNVLASHRTQLETLRCLDGSRSLAEVADAGLEALDPSDAVDAALEVKEVLTQTDVPEMPVLIAIDNYQALYTPSQYGEWLSQHHRRVLPPEELRLANAMRVLEQPPLANGLVIAAAQRAGSFSPKIRMPMPISAPFKISRMLPPEWEALTKYYKVQGTTTPVAEELVQKAFFLTLGNPKEYRMIVDCIEV